MVRRTTFLSNSDIARVNQRLAAAEERRLEKETEERNRVPEASTPAWKLFNKTFDVIIPTIHLYTEEQIAEGITMDVIFGGNKDVQSTMNKARFKHLRVFELAEIVVERYGNFTFRSSEDAADAYDVVMDHLESWADTINKPSINGIKVPWEDLVTLDKFAQWVFPRARTAIGLEMASNDSVNKEQLVLASIGIHNELNDEAINNGFINNVSTKHTSIFDSIDHSKIPRELDYGL